MRTPGAAADAGPLRILCFLHAVELGGVERAALRLCHAWSRTTDVTLALGRADGWNGDARGLDVVVAPRPPISPAYWETIWMSGWLPRLVAERCPDVIFCAGNTYSSVAAVLRLRFGRRCPPILAKISNSLLRADLPAPARLGNFLWCRVQGRLLDRFVAMTPALAFESQRPLGVAAERIATIPTPVFDAPPTSPATERPHCGGARLLLAIGRLAPQKNFALTIEAFAASGRAATDRLVILGEGPERERLQRLVAARGLAGRVTLAGHRDDVPAWLARADALVLSSDYEGVPAVVLEAMAAGVPVIATDCAPSIAEMLGDGRRGQLVPRGDIAALAAAIAAGADERHRPDAARAYAARHTVDAAAAAYLTEFRRLLAARRVTSRFEEPALS